MITASAHGQVVQNQFWAPNGTVSAVAVSNNTIYLGGQFDQIGPPTGSFVGFDVNTAAPLQPYPGVVGVVEAIVSDGTGGWYIGGTFSSVQGQPRDGLAHIDASGAVTAFGSDFSMIGLSPRSPEIDAIVLAGSTVYVGGSFGSVEGQARSCAAAFDATTGAMTSWNPNASYSGFPPIPSVYALQAYGNTVYIGGQFDAIGGQACNNLAAVDGSAGIATGWNPNVNGPVSALGILALDRRPFTVTIFAGGEFSAVNNVAHLSVAGIDAGTGNPISWAPFVKGSVFAIIPLLHGPVYIGGDFSQINGQARSDIAAIDLSTGNPVTGWDPNANGTVRGLVIAGGALYACGDFVAVGGLPHRGLAAIDLASGTPTSWNPAPGATPLAIAAGATAIFAGGYFTTAGGVPRIDLASIDATTGLPTSWTADAGVNGVITSMVLSGDKLYVGGSFSTIGGVPRTSTAAIDLNTGTVTGWSPVLTGAGGAFVRAMALSGNTMYLGGSIASVGGQSRSDLAAVDTATGAPTNWHPPSFNPSSGGVQSLVVRGATVYAGGYFHDMGGLLRVGLAAVDTSTGALTSWDPQLNSAALVNALASDGTNIWVGGLFDQAGGRPREGLAALDPIDGHANTWDDYSSGRVWALAIDGPTLYAAGEFSGLGGGPYMGLAGVDLTNGAIRPWGADFNSGAVGVPGTVEAIAVSQGRICAGGSFSGVYGYAHSNFAVLVGEAPTAVDPAPHMPVATRLSARPNPFHSELAVRFAPPEAGDVDVAIYDVSGRRVRQLYRGPMPPGAAQLEWDGRDEAGARVSTGVYIVRANSGEREMSAKVLRLE